MDITIRLKDLSNIECKTIILDLDNKGLMDWEYFWEFSSIHGPLEYLIGFFEEKVNWTLLSKNENVEWTDRRVSLFSESLDFVNLSNNKNLACSPNCIENFSDKWRWGGYHSGYPRGKRVSYKIGGLSANLRLPLDLNFLKRNQHLIDFRSFGMNSALFFQKEFLEEFEEITEKTFDILKCFEDKWFLEGSLIDDGRRWGIRKDSICDNSNIDWNHFQERLEILRQT
jgi:hypothetical protein